MPRYVVQDHASGSGYQIFDTKTGLTVSGASRLRPKDLWGNRTAVAMHCNAMNRADTTGAAVHVEPYRGKFGM